MKTFFNLVQEVQKPGLCSRCGGCAAFCNAVNYGALEIDAEGKPFYQDIEKCIECGLCYSICPEITDLDEETKRKAAWSEPMGRVIETSVVQASEPKVRDRGSDGGAITALLMHLFDRHRIDGAIVARPINRFQREPYLATSCQEILESAGFSLDTSQGMKRFSEQYMTFSSIGELDAMMQKQLKRVALVGTPCQIKSLRKMQVLNLIPSDAVKFCFGLFCSGNFVFGKKQQEALAEIAGVQWKDVVRINMKAQLILTLSSGEKKQVPQERMGGMKNYACLFCPDYSAEFSDISFGGTGAADGWTTIITRTPLGRAVLADCKSAGGIRQFDFKKNPEYASTALQEVRKASAAKKRAARHKRRELQTRPVQFRI